MKIKIAQEMKNIQVLVLKVKKMEIMEKIVILKTQNKNE